MNVQKLFSLLNICGHFKHFLSWAANLEAERNISLKILVEDKESYIFFQYKS